MIVVLRLSYMDVAFRGAVFSLGIKRTEWSGIEGKLSANNSIYWKAGLSG